MDYMQNAIEYLQVNQSEFNEIPVAAVIVKNNKIIAITRNEKEQKNDVTVHAEITAIKQASKFLENWRLEGCDMYVTLEPCPMCAWAIINSRIDNLYFGSFNKNYGAFGSKLDLRQITNTKLKVYGGIKEEDCDKILEKYFENLRENGKLNS